MPLVDKQLRHDRVRSLSLGICVDENPVADPHVIRWEAHLPTLRTLGLALAPAARDTTGARQPQREK